MTIFEKHGDPVLSNVGPLKHQSATETRGSIIKVNFAQFQRGNKMIILGLLEAQR
jgi:hypothetical protein